MARSSSNTESEDGIGDSVLESEGATESRTREEHRGGSGKFAHGPERVRCERLVQFPVAKRDQAGRAMQAIASANKPPVAALSIVALRQKSFDHAKRVIVSFRPFTLARTGNVKDTDVVPVDKIANQLEGAFSGNF